MGADFLTKFLTNSQVMKNKNQKLSIIISFCLIAFVSCQKEINNEFDYMPNEITAARAWFDANYSNGIVFSKKDSENKSQGVPDWDHALIYRHKDFSTIEVPLNLLDNVGFATEESLLAFSESGDVRFLEVRSFLVIVKGIKGEKLGFIMTIIPDKDYKTKENFKAYTSSYLKWQNKFSGVVLYHKLDGSFSNGWKFSDGKAITATKLIGKENFPADISPKSCTDYYLHTVYYQCHYEEEQQTKGWNCWITGYTVDFLYTYCSDDGGGGSGGYQSNTPNVDLVYHSSSTLDATQKLLLEAAIEGFKAKNTVFAAIWQALVNQQVRITFSINPYIVDDGLASYDKDGRKIEFKTEDAIALINLEEELIHCFQHNVYGSNFSFSIRNYEFEAKVLRDILCVKAGLLCPSIGGWHFSSETDKSNYDNWIIRVAGGEPFSTATFNNFCQVWSYTNRPTIFDPSVQPEVILNWSSSDFVDVSGHIMY